jgi:hypothetical protein
MAAGGLFQFKCVFSEPEPGGHLCPFTYAIRFQRNFKAFIFMHLNFDADKAQPKMGMKSLDGSTDDAGGKHCLHPELMRGKKGETVCSSCGRIVYLAQPTKKGSKDPFFHLQENKPSLIYSTSRSKRSFRKS